MPIHPIDEPSYLRVETRYGNDTVDLEDTDYRAKEYGRNQQREPRPRYVMQPPGSVAPVDNKNTDAEPAEPDQELEKAMNEDLRKRGVSKRNKKTTPNE